MMRRAPWLTALVALCAYGLFQLHQSSGVFSRSDIDARDLSHWQYRPDGLIDGAQPFRRRRTGLNGSWEPSRP